VGLRGASGFMPPACVLGGGVLIDTHQSCWGGGGVDVGGGVGVGDGEDDELGAGDRTVWFERGRWW
jgi:hypothetical protein